MTHARTPLGGAVDHIKTHKKETKQCQQPSG
jgi:hypothetical protein